MRLHGTFLRSTVARRVFFGFVIAALFPLTALAVLSFRTVSGQLEEQAHDQLHRETRAAANGIFERLDLLETQLALVAGETTTVAAGLDPELAPRLPAIWLLGADGGARTLRGADPAPPLDAAQRTHLGRGHTLLAQRRDTPESILMARRTDHDEAAGDLLVAAIDALYLWQARPGALPADADLCVFDRAGTPLYCSHGIAAAAGELHRAVAQHRATAVNGRTDAATFEVALDATPYLASFRAMSTAFRFLLPEITVVVVRPRAAVVAPGSRFNLYFAAIVLASLGIVLLLSSVQIRRSLDPLAALQRGTQRLAARDFGARVQLDTGDEFEQLGDSFNSMAEQIGALIDELGELNDGTLKALARTVDAKSAWTAGHSERVTDLAVRIGAAMDMSAEELTHLHQGGLLHDIGKIAVPATILDKPERLTDDEYAVMKSHPRQGQRILEPIPGYAAVIPIVLHHHERFDGGGYPDGIAGEAIDLKARVLAVADVYDAMTTDRPYRAGMPPERVVEIIRGDAGTHFDPAVVEAFVRVVDGRG